MAVAVFVIALSTLGETGSSALGSRIVPSYTPSRTCEDRCRDANGTCTRVADQEFETCMNPPFRDGLGNCYGPDGVLLPCDDPFNTRETECKTAYEAAVRECQRRLQVCLDDCAQLRKLKR